MPVSQSESDAQVPVHCAHFRPPEPHVRRVCNDQIGYEKALLEATSVKRMKSEGCVISKEAGTVYRRRERERKRKREQASERGEVRREE